MSRVHHQETAEMPALVSFFNTYRQWFIGAGSVAVIAGVMLALVASRRAEGESRAWEKMYGIMVTMSRDTAEAERLLAEVRQTARGGNTTGMVRYLAASLSYQKGDYPAAADLARQFIKGGRPAPFIPLGYLLLAQACRAAGDTAGAIAALTTFTGKHRGHALEPMAMEMLMQAYLASGDMAKARETAEQLAITNPNTEWAARAERLLSTAAPAGTRPSGVR